MSINSEIRFLYLFQKEKIIIVLNGFIKKTNKIPNKELIVAKNRKKSLDNI